MNLFTNYLSVYEAVCFGQTIVVFTIKQTKPYDTKIFIYDVSNEQWTEKECCVLKNLTDMSCVKYYSE